MPQIPVPKLPCAKLGIVNSKSGTYYYVQTYTHHYDKVKKRSVRCKFHFNINSNPI